MIANQTRYITMAVLQQISIVQYETGLRAQEIGSEARIARRPRVENPVSKQIQGQDFKIGDHD